MRPDPASWGEPPWKARPPAPPAVPPRRCEVAVVGAGITGLVAALRLARGGADVHVFEAGRVGDGASGRSGGVVLEDTAAGPLEGAGGCIPGLEALLAETGIDCGLSLPGCRELVHCRPGEAPGALWRDGERRLAVAGHVPGGALDPSALLDGLAAAALAAGAVLHEECPVQALAPGAPVRLRAGGREVRARRAVVALNAFAPALLPLAGRLHAALTFALCGEPLADAVLAEAGLGDRQPFYTLDTPYLWGRVLADGRPVFGAGLVFHPSGDPARVDVREGEGAARLRSLEERVRGLHPALAGMGIAARWGGPVAFTSDRLPLLGAAGENVLAAAGYAGHGVAFGVRAGEWLAAAVGGQRPLPAWGRLDR